MTLRVCLFVTLLLNTATVCKSDGSLLFGPRSSIVGGEDAPPGRWPWMVFLYISNQTHSLSCGGSLVTSQWVLTAAHCLKSRDMENPVPWLSYARLGVLKLTDRTTGITLSFQRFLIYPKYNMIDDTPLNDIALMKLKMPVRNSHTVAPVVLPRRRDSFSLNSECWVTGWGNIAEGKPLGGDRTLQQLQLPLVDDNTCRRQYPVTTMNEFCAGYMEGGKDSCQGDSGGPLVCKSFGRFVQVGVVSSGYGCARRDFPGVYARLYNFMNFIRKSIRKSR